MAYDVAKEALPPYAHRFSPKKFTQHQLFACLVYKDFMKLDYRGVAAHLEDMPDLRAVIDLDVVPHFTTLQKAADRLLPKSPASRLLDATVKLARRVNLPRRRRLLAAIDSSGFEAHHTSHYFVRRRAKGGRQWQTTTYRRFPKLALVVDCTSHLILSGVAGRGPGPDYIHLVQAVEEARSRRRLGILLADAGYDAEWIHEFLREWLTIRSVIPAKSGRPTDKLPTTHWRRLMKRRFDSPTYGQRWQCETVFSMIKRRLGSALGARTYWRQVRALQLKAITHNILILLLTTEVFYRACQDSFWPPQTRSRLTSTGPERP